MPINASVSGQPQIQASVGETQIDVSVSGGFGPTGSSGTIAVSAPITNAGSSTAAVIGLATGTGLAVSGGSLTVSYGTTSTSACRGDDSRLSDSREWSAATVTQAEAEAGSSTTRRAFTPQRVFQAIAAWWAGSSAKTKLDGIQSGATANATDAQLRDRATHTGTQAIGTVTGLQAALDSKAASSHTHGNITTDGKIGTASGKAVVTGENGVVQATEYVENARFLYDMANNWQLFSFEDVTPVWTATAIENDVPGQFRDSIGAAAASHVHAWSDITSGVPSTFAPSAHKTTHATGGSDALTPSDIGAASVSHTHSALSGDITGLATVATSGSAADLTGTLSASRLPSTTVTAGSYGSASSVGTFTVDATGRLTAAGSTAIAISAGAVSGLATIATSGSASDLATGTVPFARLPVGQTSTTVAAGNDARFTDQRVPTDGSVTDAKITSGGLSTSVLNWAAIQPWAANTAYAKGDLVSFQGIAYRRSAAGTSGATFNVANWQQITPSEFLASQITSGTIADARLSANVRQASDNIVHPFLLAGM